MESLDDYEIDDKYKKWLIEFLLPAIYWKSQAARTKKPELKSAIKSHLNGLWLSQNSILLLRYSLLNNGYPGLNGWFQIFNALLLLLREETVGYLKCIIMAEAFQLSD